MTTDLPGDRTLIEEAERLLLRMRSECFAECTFAEEVEETFRALLDRLARQELPTTEEDKATRVVDSQYLAGERATAAGNEAIPGLYGESHLVCRGSEHLFPIYVPCQCGNASAKVAMGDTERRLVELSDSKGALLLALERQSRDHEATVRNLRAEAEGRVRLMNALCEAIGPEAASRINDGWDGGL